MTKTKLMLALLGTGAALAYAPAAFAQATETVPQQEAASDGTIAATPPTAEESAANTAFLQAQVEALQAQMDSLKKQIAATQYSWKGAPQWTDKGEGWSFKPKGYMQFDAGFVSTPGPQRSGTFGGLNYNNLGWNSRARRIVFGAEGTLPGGFGYKAEFNFAQGQVGYEDIVLTYQAKDSPILITIGNSYPLSSLETMTSSRLTSFIERASFTDAFSYDRRLGASIAYIAPDDSYSLTAGVWNMPIDESTNFSRTGWQASVRGVYAPTLGNTRLHLGASYQHRVAQRDAQSVRYRTRPLTQITDQRFVDTAAIAADGDDIVGLELAAINGPFHIAGEAQKVWVRGHDNNAEDFGDNNAASGTFYNGNPGFWGGYAEVGFFLTGETRGYKGGKWDRTKVLKPFDKGGLGAFQLNARVDYVDLKDRVANAGKVGAPGFLVDGGSQLGYQLSLIWNPMDYVRFLAQYGRAHIKSGPRAVAAAVNDASYNVDTFAMRAQLEF